MHFLPYLRFVIVGILAAIPGSASLAQPAIMSPFDGAQLTPITLEYVTRIPSSDNTEGFTELQSFNMLDQAQIDGQDVWNFISISKTGMELSSTDIDVWDRKTLEAVRRRVTWKTSVWETEHSKAGVRATSSIEGKETVVDIPFTFPVVSDGLLNRIALGTLPLSVGYTAQYNSFVRREEAVLTQRIEVLRTEVIEVPLGTFDTYVVITELVNGDPGGARATWYVSREAPRVVVKMETSLPTGGIVTVELIGMMHPTP